LTDCKTLFLSAENCSKKLGSGWLREWPLELEARGRSVSVMLPTVRFSNRPWKGWPAFYVGFKRGVELFPFGVILSIKAEGKDRLELSPSLRFRLVLVFFFVLSCLVLLSSLSSGGRITSSIVPFILVFITGLSALYQERWIFDKRRNVFENHFGLLILYRKQSIPLKELERVELEAFIKGHVGNSPEEKERPADSPSTALGSLFRAPLRRHAYGILRLMVVDRQEKIYVLDSAKAHRIDGFRQTGRKIADFCGIPFQEN
jgi:hypothetical protein